LAISSDTCKGLENAVKVVFPHVEQKALNLISLTAFKKLQIPLSKLTPSCPFSRVGLGSIMSCGSISLLVTFGMPENYRMESILFEVVEVNLPFSLDSVVASAPASMSHHRHLRCGTT
jgi:hypothetical protein